eukprot:5324634-Pyramimonas_sp.AAC.1
MLKRKTSMRSDGSPTKNAKTSRCSNERPGHQEDFIMIIKKTSRRSNGLPAQTPKTFQRS